MASSSSSSASSAPVTDPIFRYCIDQTDFFGNELSAANPQNVILILSISDNPRRAPELRCYSWEDVRQVIDQPDTQPEERVRYWRSQPFPTNYVHKLSDVWYDSSIDVLTQRYNTLVVRDSYYAEIGTSYGRSSLSGAVVQVHVPEPVHRTDLRAFLQGMMTREEFLDRVTPSFYPTAEDLVMPAFHRVSGTQVFLGEVQNGLPYGYGLLWGRLEQPSQHRFDEDSFATDM